MDILNIPKAGSVATNKDFHQSTQSVNKIDKSVLFKVAGTAGFLAGGTEPYCFHTDNVEIVNLGTNPDEVTISISKKGERFLRVSPDSSEVKAGDKLTIETTGDYKGYLKKAVDGDLLYARAAGAEFDTGDGFNLVQATYNFDFIQAITSVTPPTKSKAEDTVGTEGNQSKKDKILDKLGIK